MVGKHGCKQARDTDLKQAIAIGLDEALTALEEAFRDLTDAQAWAFPIAGRNNIAWIVMTSLQNLDTYANQFQTGKPTFPHEWRWQLWECRPDERPKPGDSFPTVKEMLDLLYGVRVAVEAGLATATETALHDTRHAEDWWPGTAADAYMRTIFHTMAHIRQIWLLRGALGLTQGAAWPQQHWA